MKRRLLIVGALSAVAATLAPLHAGAVALIAAGLGQGTNGSNHYNAVCNGELGAATNLNQITFVVDAVGTATTTTPGVVAVGTTVTCVIKDANTGVVFGTVSGGDPGAGAFAAGLVSVPLNSSPEACVSGQAVFNDGSGVSSSPTC